MLKFFRRIRHRLLTENKFSKYLLYAIGEILLVVIGILVALQVNNWNEKRKNTAYVETILNAIEQDLTTNLNRCNYIINDYYKRDSLSELVLTNSLTKKDYWEDPSLLALITHGQPWNPMHENLNKLIENEDVVPIKYQELLQDSKRLITQRMRIDEFLKTLSTVNKENIEFRANHIPTSALGDSATTKKKIDYFLSSEIYKNKVSSSWVSYMNVYIRLSAYRARALILLIRLKNRRSKIDAKQIEETLKSFNLKPFHEANCQDTIQAQERNVFEYYPLFNLSGKTLNLRGTYLDGFKFNPVEHSVGLNEMGLTSFLPFRFLGAEYTQVIELLNEDSCEKKFISRKNGYLIIE